MWSLRLRHSTLPLAHAPAMCSRKKKSKVALGLKRLGVVLGLGVAAEGGTGCVAEGSLMLLLLLLLLLLL